MKASDTLLKPFLVGVLQDICSLFPSHTFSYEEEFLETLLVGHTDIEVVEALSKIGKAIESSLINGSVLTVPSDVFPSQDGCVYPIFLGFIWEIAFLPSGLPVFRSNGYLDTLTDMRIEALMEDIPQSLAVFQYAKEDVGAAHHSEALAVLALRQFFLSIGKITSLECLWLRAIRAGRLQEESYHTVLSEQLRRGCTQHGSPSSSRSSALRRCFACRVASICDGSVR